MSNTFSNAFGSSGGGGSVASTDITDSTAAGRTLLTAADAAAQRSPLGLGQFSVANAGLASEVQTYYNAAASGFTRLNLRAGAGQGGVPFHGIIQVYANDGTTGLFAVDYSGQVYAKNGIYLLQGLSGYSSAKITSNSLGSVDLVGNFTNSTLQDSPSFWNGVVNIITSGGNTSYGYGSMAPTTGRACGVSLFPGFVPTSGTATYAAFNNQCGINQTGGSSGITRGFLDDPVFGTVADYRSFESTVTSGSHFAFYSAGSAKVQFGVLSGTGTRPVTASSTGLLAPMTPQVVPTGASKTVDEVITALQALGIFSQS